VEVELHYKTVKIEISPIYFALPNQTKLAIFRALKREKINKIYRSSNEEEFCLPEHTWCSFGIDGF